MTSVELLILFIAMLGVVLGVINLWQWLPSQRVRLRVTPKIAFDIETGRYYSIQWNKYVARLHENGDAKRWMIEVVNLGTFPITIDEIGFSNRTADGTFSMVDPEISRGRTWPVRLEPREKAMFYSTDGVLLPPLVWASPYAYAKTDCGCCFYGRSPILVEAKQRSLI
jgi:hypothetical protein